MPTILNKWIEKIRKKKEPEKAAAYASDDYDILDSGKNPDKRSSVASRGSYSRTLRGLRK